MRIWNLSHDGSHGPAGRHRSARAWVTPWLLVFALVVSACGNAEPSATTEDEGTETTTTLEGDTTTTSGETTTTEAELEPVQLVVGHIESLLYTPMYVADAMGFFEEQGIEVEFISTPNAGQLLVAGEADMILTGSDTAFATAVQGKPTPILSVIQQRNALVLLVRTGVDLPNADAGFPAVVQDLPPQAVIGTTARYSGGEAFLQAVLQGADLVEGEDFSIVALGGVGNIFAALETDQVHATLLFPPFSIQAQTNGLGTIVVDQAKGEGPSEITQSYGAAVLVNTEFIDETPDIAARVVAALDAALAFTNDYETNAAQILQIAMEYTGIDDEAAVEAFLPDMAALADGAFSCERAAAQGALLVSVDMIQEVPPCEELAALELMSNVEG